MNSRPYADAKNKYIYIRRKATYIVPEWTICRATIKISFFFSSLPIITTRNAHRVGSSSNSTLWPFSLNYFKKKHWTTQNKRIKYAYILLVFACDFIRLQWSEHYFDRLCVRPKERSRIVQNDVYGGTLVAFW